MNRVLNITTSFVSGVILIYGLLNNAPVGIKVLLVIAIGIPLLCSIGASQNR